MQDPRIRVCPVHRRDKAHRITFPLLSQEEEEAAPHHREREVPQNTVYKFSVLFLAM